MSKEIANPTVMWSLPRRSSAPYKLPWANEYTEDAAERICEEVASGRSLHRVLIEECWTPSLLYVKRWMHEHPEFAQAYELALRVRGESLANEVVELADSSVDHDKTKLQIGARQWLSPRLNPRFNERTVVEQHTSAKVEVATLESIDVSHLTLEEIRAAEALLMKTIEGAPAIEDMREDE